MTRRIAIGPPLRLFAMGCCLALLAGCSMIRLGYGHLDTYAAWKADQYFDLEAPQKEEFRRRFDRLHQWHRYEQLPDYAAFLEEARARLQGPLRPGDVEWFIEGVKRRYARIVAQASDDAAALLYTVTPAQLEALRQQFEKDNRRFVREYRLAGSAEDIRRARARRTLEQLRDWVGSLSQEQEERVIAMADALPMTEKLRHEDRMRRQGEFLKLVATRGEDRKAFAGRLRAWLIDWDQGRTPEYERLSRRWLAQRVQMVVEMERMLTPHQRAHALGRIQDYIEDFTRLAQRPHAKTAAN